MRDPVLADYTRRAQDQIYETLCGITEEAAALARRLAPVDTGRLRDSIRFSCYGSERFFCGEVMADADYAQAVELGTSKRPATPFLRPAAKATWRRNRYFL